MSITLRKYLKGGVWLRRASCGRYRPPRRATSRERRRSESSNRKMENLREDAAHDVSIVG